MPDHPRAHRPAGLLAAFLVALLVPCAPAPAQEGSVEGRLLEILREKGIIDEGELRELQDLERELRERSSLERSLSAEIDQMVAHLAAQDVETGYRIGRGFHWRTADERFHLHIGGRLQVRFTYDIFHENEDTGDEDEPDFDVPRARIWLRGHAFEPWLEYKFQLDIAGDEADTVVEGSRRSSRNRLTELKDAHLDLTRWHSFQVRAGQYKVPYSRQQLTSTGKLEFVDRSITDRVFAPGRSVGLMVYGHAAGEDDWLLEYYAGAFDGEGENRTNDDEGLMWAGRVAVNPFGRVPYTESDLAGTESFRMQVAANAWFHQDDDHAGAGDDWSVGGDLAMFWHGFFVLGEVHYREEDGGGGPDPTAIGWLAQVGYMFIPHTLELALRASHIDFDDAPETEQQELLLALGYFIHDHNLKIQADVGHVVFDFVDEEDEVEDWRIRVQVQIIF